MKPTNLSKKIIGAKQWRQRKGSDGELNFAKFCKENDISCIKLDENGSIKNEFLTRMGGACPDYLCTRKEVTLFIEIKTHTLLTNEARSKEMTQTIRAKKLSGLSGTTVFDVFDPRPELKGVFEGYLKDASRKFKNIKGIYKFPRILLLNSHHANEFDVQAIFWGAYPSFYRGGEYAGLKKEHNGLFDSTGSNVSSVVYWNDEQKRFEGRGNPKAVIPLSDENFKEFFEITHV